MRQAHGTRTGIARTSTQQGRTRYRGVRRDKRRAHDDRAGCSRERMDGCRLHALISAQRRQDRRQPRRNHRLARARWAHQHQVMATGRSDFGCPLGLPLPGDVAVVGSVTKRMRRGIYRSSTRQIAPTTGPCKSIGQRGRDHHIHIGHQRSFSRVTWRDHQRLETL